jgi:hypothetical protein
MEPMLPLCRRYVKVKIFLKYLEFDVECGNAQNLDRFQSIDVHQYDGRRSAEVRDLVIRGRPICGRPPPRKVFRRYFDQIACVHMFGLLGRSHMNAGQDGFGGPGSKQHCDLDEGHWVYRSVPRRGSIDHTICSFACKFWHRLSTVAVSCSPCLADLWNAPAEADGRGLGGMALLFHDRPRDGSRAVP